MTSTSFSIYLIAVYAAFSALLIAACIMVADGHLIYTLDDPYIHLAVAENILKGGYGVNFPETSSPSSSILYPFILSAALALGLGNWAPLAICIAANLVTLCYAGPMLFRACIGRGPAAGFLFAVIPPLFLLATNIIGLQMTGMEHSLHLMSVVLVISGLLKAAQDDTVPLRLSIGLLLAPLIRFEGFALSLATLAILFFTRKQRAALILGALLAGCVVAYVALMYSLGLPLIPSSVMVKSAVTADVYDKSFVSSISKIISGVLSSLDNRWGLFFALGCGLLAPFCLARSAEARIALACVIMLGAHLAFGQYGWFSRYEVYAVGGLILALVIYYSDAILNASRVWRMVTIPLLLAVLAVPYAKTTFISPKASLNIYQQQYHMHRFATEFFPKVVAVNDLGWVAYRNDLFVLDLWGLGSEEARRASLAKGKTEAFMRDMTTRYEATYAMIYDNWFRRAIPSEWCRMAQFNTIDVTAASGKVAFYLIDPAQEADMRTALQGFEAILPKGTSLDTFSCTGS